MNLDIRLVLRQLGLLMLVLSALIVAVAAFAWLDHFVGEPTETIEPLALLVAALSGTLVGAGLLLAGKKRAAFIGQREALLLVALGWLSGAALCALPYWIWAQLRGASQTPGHDFDLFINCYFEAMSGLTTTGSTIIQKLATVPRSLLLWRALTQWIGGLGIVVLFVALLPILGLGTMRRVLSHEARAVSRDVVRPRIQDTARVLWMLYAGLTIAQVLALRLAGVPWFEAVCHTFATVATGGFGTLDSSIAAFSSTVQIIIVVFMVLASVNFGLYYLALHGRWRSLIQDPELRAYLIILVLASVVISASLAGRPLPPGALPEDQPGLGDVVRHAAFQVVSIETTTGFCTADFDQWGFIPKAVLVIVMFIGGSSGSTAGGVKVIRILIVIKVMLAELEHYYRPRVVRTVRVGNVVVDAELRLQTMVYLVGTLTLFAIGTTLLMILGGGRPIDITSAATAALTTMHNVGPGLGLVGATQNFAWFSEPSKAVMCILMVLGRLELFTILVLFTPKFWKSE